MRRGMRIVIAVIAALAVSTVSTRGDWPLGGVLIALAAGFCVWFLIGSLAPRR